MKFQLLTENGGMAAEICELRQQRNPTWLGETTGAST
jgi:hypothetical protein